MNRFFALMLRRIGLLDFNFLVKRVDRHPGQTEIPVGELWLVVDGGVKKMGVLELPRRMRCADITFAESRTSSTLGG